jgi:hypothetical protein
LEQNELVVLLAQVEYLFLDLSLDLLLLNQQVLF